MAAFMFRGRSLKSRRLKVRCDGSDENVILDYSKDAALHFKEILYHIAKREKLSKARRLGYYNALVRLCYRFGSNYDTGLSMEEVLCCLRLGLVHETKEVRAACLRALRYVCNDEKYIDAMLNLNMDYLIARSLDINIDNEIERIHAMRLVRKMMQLSPCKFPQSLVSVLISVANNGAQERDKLHRTCLAMLCELSFSSPGLVCRRGGVAAILHNVLQCHTLPRLNESLLSTVLYLLNQPCTRHLVKAHIGIEQLLAPFTDSHFKYTTDVPENPLGEDTTSSKYTACKMAISTLVKSWPGLIRLCKPDGTGLQSLIGVLYLPYHETRKEVLDVLFDVFRLPVPQWCDDFAQALLSVDPSEAQETWKLTEGFVAAEGASLLKHLAQARPNLVDNHSALVLSAFVTGGLLEALVEVITDADSRVSVRATILLGELLHLANSLIPVECGYHSHCLPTLIDLASSFSNPKRNKASMAVKCLDRLHNIKKRGLVPSSLFLDQLVRRARSRGDERVSRPLTSNRHLLLSALEKPAAWHHKPKKLNTLEKLATANNEAEHDVNQAIRDSHVLQTKENLQWDWQLIAAILKWPDDSLKKLEDQSNQRFVRRVLFFFKPANKLFSTLELSNPGSREIATAGQHFLYFLLNCDNDESKRYLKEWLGNVGACLSEIKGQRAPPEALLSTHRVINTCAQYYFLYLGLLSGTPAGNQLLDFMGIYQTLLELVSSTCHDNYVKLVVSSLDYGKDGLPRVILAKALAASSDSARLYCVNLLRVLLRARVPFFQQWGLEYLVLQLYDQARGVQMEALSVLSEACEDETHLQSAIKLKPAVLQLGTKGAMLLARFLSQPQGYNQLAEASCIQQQLDTWNKELNAEYVDIVEEKLYEAFTTYEKTYDGSYSRRTSRRQSKKEVYVPIHIYGQLVQHREGYALLQRQRQVDEYIDVIHYQTMRTDEEVHKVKEALWALGHVGTSTFGLDLLQEHVIIPQMIKLAEESGVFSVRGTAFYVLGLISCTYRGADILNELGWESVRHRHTEKWPVQDDPATQPPPPSSDPTPVLAMSLSGTSLASSVKSEGFLLPAVTLEPPSSASATPSFSIGEEASVASSLGKSRSNTVNTLETLSENEGGDLDDEADDRPLTLEIAPRDGNSAGGDEEQLEVGVVQEQKTETNHVDRKPSGHPRVSELLKVRSVSAPIDYDKKSEQIHPRTTSDPRGMSQDRLDGQAAVHFKDPDLDSRPIIDKSILRTKKRGARSGDSGDAGIGSQSEPSSYKSRSASFSNGDRAGSHDSYRTATDKSRSSSVNTDTSGVSSLGGSYPAADAPPAPLSPIPSASSVQSGAAVADGDSLSSLDRPPTAVHPSDMLRRASNLKRVPSTRRRFFNPVLSPVLRTMHRDADVLHEYAVTYTSTRDVQGYATLRELKRWQRAESNEGGEAETRVRSLCEQPSPLMKTQSLDLRVLGRLRNSITKRIRRPLRRKASKRASPRSGARNPSTVSLQDMDTGTSMYSRGTGAEPGGSGPGLQRIPTIPNIRKPKPVSTGRPQYAGICLPVDVNMVFQVNEGEDLRSVRRLRERVDNRRKKSRVTMESEAGAEPLDDGLEHHTADICLACYKSRGVRAESGDDSDYEEAFPSLGQSSPALTTDGGGAGATEERHPRRGIETRHTSLSELVDSVTRAEAAGRSPMSEDTFAGQVLVRKEILRLVVNCSSSVSTESTEQALLILKQKFPKTFQDVCLYSEIAYILATYNYRLKARKFIQELFQDMTFEKLYEGAAEIAEVLRVQLRITEPSSAQLDLKLDEHDDDADPFRGFDESIQDRTPDVCEA